MALKQHVILAAGHGGGDAGAIGQNTTEANETISIVDHLVAKLNIDGRIAVDLVPHNLGLVDSINWVNARFKNLEDGLAIEVHKNSGGGSGHEVWTPSYPDQTSRDMAQAIVNKMASVNGLPNRGVKEAQNNRWGRLGWCDDTKTYALLIEAAFIDVDPVGSAANERYAEGIYQGLLAMFGLGAKAPAPAPIPAPAPVTERKIERYANTVMYMVKPGLLDDKAVLWNTTFTDWAGAKGVTAVPRLKADGTPTPIEIAGEIKHPLGATYLVTKSSADRNTANGFNRNDLTLYVPPTPVEQPNVPIEVPVDQTPKPTEPTPTPPTDQPDPRDTEQDARIGALEAAIAGLITLLASIGKAIVDGVSKLKK